MLLLLMAARSDTDPPTPETAHRLLAGVSDRMILSLSRQHGARGLLFEFLDGINVDRPALMERLREGYAEAVRRHMRATAEVVALSRILAGVEDWGVIKGPVLVEEAYGARPGRRAYYDIDVLVRPRNFGTALEVLERSGAMVLDRNWRMLRRDMRGELLVRLASGTGVDLHWHLINMYRRRTRMDMAEIAERLRPVSIGPARVMTLDAEDGVIHLALHAALSGGDRLSWLKDIERAVRAWQPDWSVIGERCRRWRIAPAVGLMLLRSRRVLRTPVPEHVAEDLVGRRIADIDGIIERRWPWAYAMDRIASPNRVFVRGSVHGLGGAAAWIAWRSLRNLDPRQAERSSAFRERGSDLDRRQFLAKVAAQDSGADRTS